MRLKKTQPKFNFHSIQIYDLIEFFFSFTEYTHCKIDIEIQTC